ncbi:uncharacterized protein At4g15545-like [Cucurbita maxima]|uniref:Uncharacterized protein At4g15545-like n=1 Tax=Cucurbita maxima TaxID=3661 RepID=A0A6J1JCV1_CUCMA|nr:uncharacterized protein At4g15545-like [Cucurbita maxima]XP_022986006.1 uncharacterized protein At4g15545-like [Cucurbita maxima]
MSQSNGPDFNLPDEILAVIPTDPYDQLDLARKITSMAIASRVSNLEADMVRMKQKLNEKEITIYDLQKKLSHLEHANQEAESRLKIALDDNTRLSMERDALSMTSKKLGRDLAKLETFKRQLMLSLNDESSQTETVDIGTCDQAVPKAYTDKDEVTDGHATRSFSGSTETRNTIDEGKHLGQRFSSLHITPRFTPSATPKTTSKSVSPRGYSSVASPQITSGSTSPTKLSYDGRIALSPWYPSSQQSSAASSPPRSRPLAGRPARVDGKEFFRLARSRLSYEQFSAFLSNIKELNSQKQTREETLRKAEEIFGTDNKDLFLSFQGLLNRNIH